MISDDDITAMLESARAYRARVDELPERAEIDAAVRAQVTWTTDFPEPPAEHEELINEIVEFLQNTRLSPSQAHELECAFFNPR